MGDVPSHLGSTVASLAKVPRRSNYRSTSSSTGTARTPSGKARKILASDVLHLVKGPFTFTIINLVAWFMDGL